MIPLRVRHFWLLLAPAVLIGLVMWPRAGSIAGQSAPAVAMQWAEAQADAPALPGQADSALEVAPEPIAAQAAVTATGIGLDQHDDLFAYASSLQAAAAAGDASANWQLSRVYDYCSGYALDPAGFAADSQWLQQQQDPGIATMLLARQRMAHSCGGFTAADGLSAQQVMQQRLLAAKAGNLAAEAALLAIGQPLQTSAEYRHGLVQRVLDARDPEAYLALAPAMGGAASGDDALRDYVAGDQYAELAWQVAACRLGEECGAHSSLMTGYCANGGICSQDASQDFEKFVFDAAISRQGAARMTQMIYTLVDGGEVKS